MEAQLKRFRIQNFRSIVDSGWIEAESLTCLVGTNESGKTNLLIGLWKLNPANDEPIVPLSDYPRKRYVNFESTKGAEVFVQADFELKAELAEEISTELGYHKSLFKIARVERQYNGLRVVSFPVKQLERLPVAECNDFIESVIESLNQSDLMTKETPDVIEEIKTKLKSLKYDAGTLSELNQQQVQKINDDLTDFLNEKYKRKVNINTFFDDYFKPGFAKIESVFGTATLNVTKEVTTKILNNIPSFVYYSDYGNLDSEIYLPHVIQNFSRTDLGEKERAKARSLKVLFEFVNLKPQEILELGKENITNPTETSIDKERESKKKREILLQSASSMLTDQFREWWKQGNYRFRFQADGNHFRIWVSDDLRTEEVELEGRSKGLQWFFSFFLVFLVESKDSHSNCILLLDEPGISLHPIAQYHLLEFFSSLSRDNQLIYTTHSPFLVDPNNLGNVKALYVGADGSSIVSSDLRANVKVSEKSIYPIHAAIGLTVSDTLLLGCTPLLVEGPSDQIYLQLIKNYLIAKNKYLVGKELLFIPTGGVSGMSPVIKILLGRENQLPCVIVDSDSQGRKKEKDLRNGLYKDEVEKIIPISTVLGDGDFEVEDLLPKGELARLFSKKYRAKVGDDFEYIVDESKPIVNQMEVFAHQNDYKLELGWKVELAKDFHRVFDRIEAKLSAEIVEYWSTLFNLIK
jgi:predicted ATP-dependent endonuclease of OLD family